MAATVEMKNNAGETRWFFTVDAKEILAMPDCEWKMTGQVDRSGWATPSAASLHPTAQPQSKTQEQLIADGISSGLARALGNSIPKDVEPAGLPADEPVVEMTGDDFE